MTTAQSLRLSAKAATAADIAPAIVEQTQPAVGADEAVVEILAAAVRQVIRNGLAILGVSCPQSMKSLNPRDVHES